MTALCTADLHFSDSPRDSYRFEIFPTLRKLIRQHKVHHLLVLGDLTEAKNKHDAWLVNKIVDEFYNLSQHTNIIIQTGNHDYTDPANPFFMMLGRMNNVSWINRPTKVQIFGLPDKCLLLPHTSQWEKDWKDLDFESCCWIFCHQAFEGATSGFGHTLEGIPTSIFPDHVRVISGDIHVPQRVGPVTYVGAPYTIDFGDAYEGRVLLLEGTKKKTIPIIGPQKVLIELDSINDLVKPMDIYQGDILKVRLHIRKKNYASWHSYQTRIREWGIKYNFQIHMVEPIITDNPIDSSVRSKQYETKTDEQILEDYAKNRGLDERTVNTGLRIVEFE